MMETVILVAWGAAMFVIAGALAYILLDNTKLHGLIDKVRRDGVANEHQAVILDIHIDAVHRRIKELDEKIDDVKGDTALIETRMSKVRDAVQQNCKHKWGLPQRGLGRWWIFSGFAGTAVTCETCGMEKYIDEKEAQKLTAAYHKRKATEAEKE